MLGFLCGDWRVLLFVLVFFLLFVIRANLEGENIAVQICSLLVNDLQDLYGAYRLVSFTDQLNPSVRENSSPDSECHMQEGACNVLSKTS